MRLLPLILITLLGLELGLPYHSCQMEDSCRMEEVKADSGAEAAHACCAAKDTQKDEHQDDCQDDCSCSCCRVLLTIYPNSPALATITATSPSRPGFRHGSYWLDFGSAIWEPPQLA
jgi:hypothetical protein